MDDAVRVEQRPHALQGQVVAAQRRPGVAADEGADAHAGAAVAAALVEDEAHERLDAAEVDGALIHHVAVVERHRARDLSHHLALPPARPARTTPGPTGSRAERPPGRTGPGSDGSL